MRYDAAPDDVANAYRKLIRENIDYDSLVIVYSYDRELIDGIVDLILETVLCRQECCLPDWFYCRGKSQTPFWYETKADRRTQKVHNNC